MRALFFAAALSLSSVAFAGTPVPLEELPAPVLAALQDYFPGSTPVIAERDFDDGQQKYEVKIRYKAILLEVDVAPNGRILDVDMD